MAKPGWLLHEQIMRKEQIMRLVALAILLVIPATQVGALDLVVDGRSDYVIVLAADAIPAEQFAAEELANHLEKMSGAKLPIVTDAEALSRHAVLLGRPRYLAKLEVHPDWAEFGKEGYLLQVKGDYLIIAGGRPRGTLYGVYALLEDYLGCRWFAPDTTVIPQSKTIKLPRHERQKLNIIGKPSFEYRDPWMYAGHIWSWWWKKHFDADYVSRTRNSGRLLNQHVHPIDERHGGYYDILHGGHNLSSLVPAELYAKDHPEYYALWEGRRMNKAEERTNRGDFELCLTDPAVVRIAAENMRKWMRDKPNRDMFYVCQSDTGIYCQCERCQAMYDKYKVGPEAGYGGYAGRNIWFVNQIASLVEDEFPNNRIGTWAYGATRNPPKNIKAHRNVVLCYLPIERCWCHAIDHGLINVDYYALEDGIRKWKEIAQEVQLWDYNGAGELILTIAPNVRAAKRLGMTGVLVDAIIDIQSGFGFLRYWMWTQSMRNADWDDDWGLREFLDAYYGAAAPYIDRYIRIIANPRNYVPLSAKEIWIWNVASAHNLIGEGFAEGSPRWQQLVNGCRIGYRRLTDEAIERGYALFEQARKAVANDPKARDHVEAARMELQYIMLEQLPADDSRLKEEATSLLRLAKKLEMRAIRGSGTFSLKEFRDKISKRLGVKIPD